MALGAARACASAFGQLLIANLQQVPGNSTRGAHGCEDYRCVDPDSGFGQAAHSASLSAGRNARLFQPGFKSRGTITLALLPTRPEGWVSGLYRRS